MRYTLLFAGILVLTGCGSLTNNDVESEIEIDTPTDLSAEGGELELFAPTDDNSRINFQEDSETIAETEPETALGAQADAETQEETLTQAQQDTLAQETVDVLPQVVETETNRISPVTGPAIPEEEMRKILEAK